MTNLFSVVERFIEGDYFIVFILMMLVLMIVLILELIKLKEDNGRLAKSFEEKQLISTENESIDQDNFFEELDLLKATTKEDIIDEEKPLLKQICIPEIKTYDQVISDYEDNEEENAVISTSELEKKSKERLETLGTNDNRVAIEKYEEEQENKAIISYEQLLKNAKNITLSYKEEENNDINAPKINKVEITQKEISAPENYLEEEEFLKILKSFRMSL